MTSANLSLWLEKQSLAPDLPCVESRTFMKTNLGEANLGILSQKGRVCFHNFFFKFKINRIFFFFLILSSLFYQQGGPMSKPHGNSIKNIFGLTSLLSCANDCKFIRNFAVFENEKIQGKY